MLAASQSIPYGTPSIMVGGVICSNTIQGCPPNTESVRVTIDNMVAQAPIGNKGAFGTTFDTQQIPASMTAYVIDYFYPGDNTFASKDDQSTTLTVNKAAPDFSGLSHPADITFGFPQITLSGTICAPTACPQSGNIQITIDSFSGPAPIGSKGLFTTTTFDTHNIPADPNNPYPVTYAYPGDNNFEPKDDNNSGVTLRVNKAASTFASLNSNMSGGATYGTPATFTATVSGVANAKAPTGNVMFTDTYTDKYNNVTTFMLCTQPLQGNISQSVATCDPPNQMKVMQGGMHSIVVTYAGDGNYNSPPPFPALKQKVNPATPAFSNSTKNSVYGTGVTLTAVLNGPANVPGPTGTVVFTDTYTDNSNHQMPPTTLCSNVNLTQGTGSSTATCTPAPPALLSGAHVVTATYSDDTNFTSVPSSTIVTQSVARFQTMGSVSSSTTQNTSLFGQTVTFTAQLTGAGSSYTAPTGNISFTGAGTGITGCSNVPVDMNTETATCTANSLPAGAPKLVATYGGDNNYAVVTPDITQTVQYFQLSPNVAFTTVVQSFNNTNTPYTSKTLPIAAMPFVTTAYGGNLAMSCAIAPVVNNGPTCQVAPDMTTVPTGMGAPAVLFTTLNATPIGNYTVTITGQPVGATGNMTSLQVNVGQFAGTLLVPGNTSVPFVGPAPQSLDFACAQIIGANGTALYVPGQDNIYHITCNVSPGTATVSTDPKNPTQISVTITPTSTQQAALRTIQGIFCMGMPAMVLVGSLRFGKMSRSRILQILGLMLVTVSLLQVVACGSGGFTPPPRGSTPAGSYQMVVVGTTADGVKTSAIVPFVVNP